MEIKDSEWPKIINEQAKRLKAKLDENPSEEELEKWKNDEAKKFKEDEADAT